MTTSPELPRSGLVTIRIYTKAGDEYSIPNVNLRMLEQGLPKSGRIDRDLPSLSVVNIHLAALIIPFRIIDKVMAKGVELWVSPALAAEKK